MHPPLFAELADHRRRSPLSRPRKLLYPVLYGERKLIRCVRWVKPLLDRAGVWTLWRRGSACRYMRTSSRCRPNSTAASTAA